MVKIKRSGMNESDSMYFNGYTYDTVPDVPSIGGIPQYNPMIVDDRIELMDEVIKELEDYWYSEDPKLEDEITRITKRDEELYVKDIFWKLENPDVVTVKFGLNGFDGSNDRVAETRDIEINFESFLGRDIEGDLVKFLSSKIKSLLDNVLHGGLYSDSKNINKKLEQRIKRLEKLIKEGYQSYDIDEASKSIYNDIRFLASRINTHIDELKIERRYDQIADWQDALKDIRDLERKVDSII